MEDDLSQKDSETWFGDVAGSRVYAKEMASGFFEMHKGKVSRLFVGRQLQLRVWSHLHHF